MKIDFTVYREFYEILKNQFISKELAGNVAKGRGRDTPQLWLHRDKGTKKVIASELFSGSRTSNPQYFYRKYIEFQPENANKGGIDAVALSKGLKYVGISLPENSRKKLSADEEAALLLKEFVAKHKLEGLANSKNTFGSKDTAAPQSENLQKVIKVINDFYNCLGAGQYEPAWDLLTPSLQGRVWKDDINKFIAGYQYTFGIRNIHVFQLEQTAPASVDCQAYYEDETSSYPIKEFTYSRALKIKDINSFVETVKELAAKASGFGNNEIENIELFRLFDPTVSDYIRYKCDLKESEMEDIFAEPVAIFTKKIYFLTCRHVGHQWLIERIVEVKTWALR